MREELSAAKQYSTLTKEFCLGSRQRQKGRGGGGGGKGERGEEGEGGRRRGGEADGEAEA